MVARRGLTLARMSSEAVSLWIERYPDGQPAGDSGSAHARRNASPVSKT